VRREIVVAAKHLRISAHCAPVYFEAGRPGIFPDLSKGVLSMRKFVCAATLLAAAVPAHADWTGKGEAGLVVASGNTNTETANAKLALSTDIGNWKHGIGGDVLYASDEEGKAANRYEVFGQSDWNFTEKNFLFAAARYEQDEFSGFEYQATASLGAGRRFIDNDVTKFVGTLGAGYKFLETRDAFDDETGVLIEEGESDKEVVFRGTLDFEHKFTETTSLLNKFIVESGAENTFAQNDLALQVKMTDVLALAVGYSVRHNTQPPAGFQETDTLTTINLVYEIK
jgi:putative salt-induced outer membrane protein